MAFCSSCGQKLKEGAKFCTSCGTPVEGSNNRREQIFEGNIHKCPNCGETIGAFCARCPSCGHEFRNAQASSAAKEFERKLQEIESQRASYSNAAAAQKKGLLGMHTYDMEALGVTLSPIDAQKISLIRSFPVPNTKEDILEFMTMATANAIDSAGAPTTQTEIKINKAWEAKAKQIYQKARISFGAEPEFVEIQEMYDSMMTVVKKNNRNTIILGLILLLFLAGILFFMMKMGDAESKQADRMETELNKIVVEIQQDIAAGEYDSALMKANKLRFDKKLGREKAKQWDEQREYLIDLINEKKGE